MGEINIRVEGRAGRITLTRPQALNALSYHMCRAISAALDEWRADPAVTLVVIDAEGARAFCAGGDVAEVWQASMSGDPGLGRAFWRDEYRMNAKLAEYPKPVVSLMQGFIMGGGVGLGCHVRHRVVAETAQVAMPESGIGLIPDVGGTLLLSRAPGRLGEYLGLTAARLGPDDAIHAGFADHFIPQAEWPNLIDQLCATGDVGLLRVAAQPVAKGELAQAAADLDAVMEGRDAAAVLAALEVRGESWAVDGARAIRRNSPLSMAATLALLRGLPAGADIRQALQREYRFVWRAAEQGLTDFLEGVRAQIIDKDRRPRWRHAAAGDVTAAEVEALLAPLGAEDLTF
ncbi:MAG: enoyl-CoA hydratase/isomerase family protein [Paracoccaceae bacterium]